MSTEPNRINVLAIHPSGATVVRSIEPSLEALQDIVGGDIEALFGETFTAYINEDGKLLGLPRNAAAEAALNALGVGLFDGDWIAGPIVFVGAPDAEGDDTSIDEDVLALIRTAVNKVGA